MFSTKQSVDRHVSNILGRIRDEKERNNRGYQIARLYYEVKEYELAKRYVAGFLSVKESFAPAHKLLGQILEGLNQREKAIIAYKRSLDIDDKQKDVILKICELYLQTDIDPERAKYWAERAEKVWPHHDTVFKLREKIYTEREGDRNMVDLENLIASELAKRPKDPKLRAKLMRLYIDTGRINEAYDHAVDVEKKAAYPFSLEWYQCLQDVFQVYQEETGDKINGVFHQNLLLAQCHLASLTLEQCKVADAADALHRFDQTIQSAGKVSGGDDWQVVYREMQSQLYFLAGTLLLKRAQQDHLGWLEAAQMAAACYTASYAYEPPQTKAAWYAKASEEDKKVFNRMVQLANFRASQTGHMMKQMCKGDSQKWISSLKESQFGEKGRGRLYDTLFTLRHLKGSKSSSYLYQGSALSSLLCVYPTDAQLKEYDKESHLLHASSLHHLIWTALQYYSVRDRTQPNYNFTVFEDLQYSVTNLELASPESLSHLDTQIFLYAAVRTTALHQQEQQRVVPASGDRPSVLPVLISDHLCTVEQNQWWNTAFQLFKNTAKENLGKLRLVLQRGIETVRLCRNHGMDVSLVVHVARTFEERVEELKAKSHSTYDYSNEIDHLQNRAVQYWREACDMLERIQRNQSLPSPKQKLFASYETHLSDKQIKDLLEEGNFFLACDAMKHGEDEEAVEEFDKLSMAEASYYQAQILRKMADEAVGNMTRGQEEEVEEQEEALLTRARDALYLTMDRTRDNKHHKLAPHLATELDEIESRLNRMNSNKSVNDSQRSEVKGDLSAVDDVDLSSKVLTTPSAQSTPHPKPRPKVTINESPQKPIHTQPSPERLDAQIRSLSFSQDTLIKQLMERNEELVKQNAAILAELSASRKLIEKLMTARPIEPPAAYPVVMPAAAASPLHHPGMAHHPAAAQSPLGPHATSTPPRHVQPVPPAAASPFYGSPYRPHPDYEYAAAYSPHAGYPIYPHGAAPPPPLHHYAGYPHDPASQPHAAGGVPQAVPATSLGGAAGKEPSAAGPVKSTGAHIEEDDDYYYCDDDEDGGEYDDGEGDMFQVPESQLVQDWPYGNSVSISGKSTINYSPQRNQPQQLPAQPTAYYGQGPATTGLPMPGPGFFSSPERPTGAYNAARYIAPNGLDACSPQLHPPRPGFIGTIGSPVSNAQTPPSATTANKTGGIVSGRSPAQTGANTTEAALTGGSLIKMPQPPQASAATKFAIPISASVFPNNTGMSAAMATGAPITTVTGVGSTGKDVQPKSPGANDEDDDEGTAGDDSYQGPEFEPIIPLPDEVEVKTGEEEEKVLFVSRCKLYRFTENQWKERGLGDIKILWKEETGQARVVMRREQVLKVCANHYIQPNMKIDFKSEKELKILTWIGMDFSEDDGLMQKFSCRFKTEETARDFKAKFEEAKELVAKYQKQNEGKGEEKPKEVKKTDGGVDLLAKLKPKPGSWNCEACYVNNPPEVIACLACTTPKPGTQMKTPQQKSIFGGDAAASAPSSGGFTFGSATTKPGGTSFTFGQTPTTTPDAKSKPTTGFTFGTPSSGSTSQTGFTFGSAATGTPSGGFKFGTSAVTTTTINATETKTTPTISPPKFTFNKPVTGETPTPASDTLKLMAAKADSTQPSDKPTFGGFTFTSKPVVNEEKKEEPKKVEPKIETKEKEQEAPKVNPFASFSFGPSSTVSKPANTKTSEVPAVPFGASTTSTPDFASLVSKDDAAFTKKTDFKGFDGAGAKLFDGGKDEAADESGHAEDYEPDVDFKPIIPLPDLVEVKTGEEDELKLFGHRAKLYRHDNESKQWKERGVGEMKILKHKQTGRCRVLMRREQVLKLCANHYITVEMSLNPLKTSDRAWCWYANDYSEDEMKFEQLAVKFKAADVADKFKEAFEKCQEDIANMPTDLSEVSDKKEVSEVKPESKTKPSLGEMFKPKVGQWECQVCYVQNQPNVIVCVACQTPKPGQEAEAAKQKASEPKKDPFAGGFKIAEGAVQSSGQSTGQVFTFGNAALVKKADDTPTKTGFLFGMPTSPRTSSFSFNTASTPVSATTAESSGTPAGPFNLNTSGFKFGATPSADTTKTPAKEAGSAKTFGLNTSGFTFTPTSTPAKQDKTPKSPQSPEGDYYVNTEDEDSHIYFEPIVQLPEKVDLVTGEEDEEPLYCHRAKLFRYDDSQWKERGLGDIKILRHKQTKKCRIVMRREQILKICLNHMISDSLELQPMQNSQGKAWVWVATDFAEGEASDEKLAIKFKTADIANEFKKAFDDAKEGKGEVLDLPPTPIKVRERTDSSSRDSTRERKDSARERKDSARERERRHSAGKSETPDKTKTTTSLDSFSFKPQTTSSSGASTSTPKVSFTFGSSESQVSSVFGGSSAQSSVPGKFSFGSGAAVSTGFTFGTTPTKPSSEPSVSGTAGAGDQTGKTSGSGTSLLAQMLMSDEPIHVPDLEITYEKKPSKEQVEKAAEFKLPSTFYNYEDATPCPGCRGCEDDDDYHKDVIFIKEEMPSQDKVTLAQKYMLPKSFYMYENKPPCPGCLGCDDDIEGTIFKGKSAITSVKTESKKEEKVTVAQPSDENNTTETSLFGGKTSSEFSFAAIAAKSPPGAFGFGNKSGSDKPFSFVGSGSQLFKNVKPGEDYDGNEDEIVQSEDIHFEPIVHLEEVEVKTGEEEEMAIYSQRSKLFRYTDGQWKERGIGDMKILKHNKTGRFRLLMRREQILKICCNHQITADLELRPMNTSEVAWCWFATDFTDGQPVDEQFALKFKNQDLARQFRDKVTECQQILETFDEESKNNSAPTEIGADTSVVNKGDKSADDVAEVDTSTASGQDAEHSYTQSDAERSGYDQSETEGEAEQSGYSQSGAEGGADDDDDEYVTDEEDEMQLLFSKRATMFYEDADQSWKQVGMGDLQVVYDDDVNGNRIRMTKDNGALICNHIICKDYQLQCNEKKKFVEWTAKDFSTDEPIKRTFRVQFSSKNAVAEFKAIFAEGLELAKEWDIREVTDFVPTPIFSEK